VGHLIFLKFSLQAILVYTFYTSTAPKQIMKAIKYLQIKFYWQGTKANKKWALVAWDTLCFPKENRGLGLTDPETLNGVL